MFTDKVALDLDKTQYETGDGPCLAAMRHRGVEHFVTASDDRWPLFRAAAEARSVLSSLAVPLCDDDSRSGR